MQIWTLLILSVLVFMSLLSFRYFWAHRRIIDCHTGMNIAMTMGGLLATLSGIALIMLFPTQYLSITLITMSIGIAAGILFGMVGDLQSVIAGVACGIMSGLMSPMVAAMLPDPFLILIYISIIQGILLGLLCFSVHVLKNKNHGRNSGGLP